MLIWSIPDIKTYYAPQFDDNSMTIEVHSSSQSAVTAASAVTASQSFKNANAAQRADPVQVLVNPLTLDNLGYG
jgi:hypothetical protein